MTINAVDLFCGAGGLTKGLCNAGVTVKAGFDLDDACRYPFEENNPGAKFIQANIGELSGDEVDAYFSKRGHTLLVGCAPCQPFSSYTQGLETTKDPKWGLLEKFAEIVDETDPDIVSMENVLNLERHAVYARFCDRLEKLDYTVVPYEVYCPDYGVPQKRKRLVLFASKYGAVDIIEPTHDPEDYVTVEDQIGDLEPLIHGSVSAKDPLHKCSELSELNMKRMKVSRPGGTWRDWPEDLVSPCHRAASGKTYPGVYARMRWDEPSPTITTQAYGFGNGRYGHPEQDRAISLREMALLQTFPPDYSFAATAAELHTKTIGRLIGNAVPVRLGEVIGLSIIEHLKVHRRK